MTNTRLRFTRCISAMVYAATSLIVLMEASGDRQRFLGDVRLKSIDHDAFSDLTALCVSHLNIIIPELSQLKNGQRFIHYLQASLLSASTQGLSALTTSIFTSRTASTPKSNITESRTPSASEKKLAPPLSSTPNLLDDTKLMLAERLAYEAIHSGDWKMTPVAWRKAYGLTALALARSTLSQPLSIPRLLQAIHYLDKSLFLAHPDFHPPTHSLISGLYSLLPPSPPLPTSSPSPSQNSSEVNMFTHVGRVLLIKRERDIDIEAFQEKAMERGRPLVIEDGMGDWPALTEGDRGWEGFGRLVRVGGWRTVPVEVGSAYTNEGWSIELMSLNRFLNKHVCGSSCDNQTREKIGYLAQHQLLDQIPALAKDIRIPKYCRQLTMDANGREIYAANLDIHPQKPHEDFMVQINAWIGPGGTVTPLHFDRYHNILAQVVGAKRIILFSPSCSDKLSPHKSPLNNTSQVDLASLASVSQHASNLSQLECYDFVLHRGEMLYIPPGWWHFVQALEPSASINFWW